MLFQDAIMGARSELGDTYEGNYSYQTADMLRYAVDGVNAAWGKRPSLKYSEATGKLYVPADVLPAAAPDENFAIPLPDDTQVAITYFVIYRCLSRDITDAGNAAAAAAWKTLFDQTIAG